MIYTVPDDYSEFKCLMSACPASCCEGGWKIVIDDHTLQSYREMTGALGQKMEQSIDWEDKTFRQKEGRCAFLNGEKLCEIHVQAGRSAVCNTCRTYPKHIEKYENEREISLSLSCPAVAEMVLGRTAHAEFRTIEQGEDEFDFEFDNILYTMLQDTREVLFAIAQNRSERITARMAKLLALASEVQDCIDEGQMFDIPGVLERYEPETIDATLRERLSEVPCRAEDTLALCTNMLEYLKALEVLDPQWSADLQLWGETLYAQGAESYAAHARDWDAVSKDWETEYEQVLLYYLFTYFCGAVYDGDALGKVQLAVGSILLLRAFGMAEWLRQEGRLDRSVRVQLVWRYAREIEHSDPNRMAMEKIFGEWEEERFEQLLVSLLRESE